MTTLPVTVCRDEAFQSHKLIMVVYDVFGIGNASLFSTFNVPDRGAAWLRVPPCTDEIYYIRVHANQIAVSSTNFKPIREVESHG